MAQHKKRSSSCLNCDNLLHDTDAYCPQCGQENHDLHVPVKHLLLELIEGVLHFDAKFFQTAKLLLFKPGKLTEEYNAGRRTRFVPPVRSYIFVSFIFFLLLSLNSGKHTEAGGEHQKKEAGKDTSAAIVGAAAKTLRANARMAADSLAGGGRRGLISIDAESDSATVAFVDAKVKKLQSDNFHGFYAMMFRTMSYMMFLLMPFAALLVSAAFRTPRRFYIDHLVFSVHYHCFAFLLISANILASLVIPAGWTAAATGIILVTYLFLALRNVYKESAAKTLVKMALVSSGYAVVLGFSIVASVVISVFWG